MTRSAGLLCLALLITSTPVGAQNASYREPDGGGEVVLDRSDHLTDEQRQEIRAQIDASIARLQAEGKISSSLAATTLLTWPLAQVNGLNINDPHGVSNFVDLDNVIPSLLDYNCGARTYDVPGYNHAGIDYFTWPYGWLWMDTDKVAVVAAAPGTIVLNSEGFFDRNCAFNAGNWNAVYVRHADGSVAWYGHLKRGSVTTKPAGATVERGEYLGIVGSSGNSTGPHLHMELQGTGGNIIEPHTGPCNSITPWWQQQRPYYDSRLNMLQTGLAPADFGVCPQQETPNSALDFNAGDLIHFTAFYHDQLGGQVTNFTIYRPDQSVFTSWSHSSGAPHYAASWWYWIWDFTGQPSGIYRFEVTYQGQTLQHYFSLGGPFPSGRVPATSSAGTPLTVTHATGGDINLSWGSSCLGTETDYDIYEGVIGDWYTHVQKQCSTGGLTTATITPDAASSYYIVVPRNEGWDGSYGINSLGDERPFAAVWCRAQFLGGCCGDGVLDRNETCDGLDTGPETCQTQGIGTGTLSCNATCDAFDTSGCVPCGDNLVDPPEVCDGSNLNGQTCVDVGFAGGGTLACEATCDAFNTSGCGTICGDGVRQGAELCDNADHGGMMCSDVGWDGGTLACNATCDGWVTTGCTTVCGDGVRKGNEACDGVDLGGQTCFLQGFDGGRLACNGTCDGFDTSMCAQCGNNIKESGEVCDGTDLGGETCLSQGQPDGTLQCHPSCSVFDFTLCVGF